jgi:hypothetical protein
MAAASHLVELFVTGACLLVGYLCIITKDKCRVQILGAQC